MHLLVTRPQPDADTQAKRLKAAGHEASVAPLLKVSLHPEAIPALDDAQAIVVTSRNAVRALAQKKLNDNELRVPVFAVGDATAANARGCGFMDVSAGPGTAAELAPLIAQKCKPDAGPLVYLAGKRLAFDLKPVLEQTGFEVSQPVVYRSEPVESLPQDALSALREGEIKGVILMSPETARSYAELVRKLELEAAVAEIQHFCLSANVAQPLEGISGLRTQISEQPTQDALLALIAQVAAN